VKVPCTDPESEALYLRSCIGVTARAQFDHMADPETRLDPDDMFVDTNRALCQLLWSRVDAKQAVWKHELKTAAPSLADALDRILCDPGDREQKAGPIADHLRAMARRRRKYEALSRAAAALADGQEDAADEHVLTVASEQTEQRTSEYMDGAETVRAAAEEELSSRKEGFGRRTGFLLIDKAVGNLRAKTMAVIGGTTGAGKSSLMLAMALKQTRRGVPVGIVSTEDAESVWGERLYADISDESMADVSEQKLDLAVHKASVIPIRFAYELNRPLKDVLRAIRHLVRKHGCQVIYVDYLQAISDPQKVDRRHFIGKAASQIKAQCQELGVSLVVGSQVSRPSKEKPFGEIFTNDLKESGDIENMSEIVMLLWKNGDKDTSLTLGKVAKVKWSAARPRFQLQRSRVGSVNGVVDQMPQRAPYENESI
jgi:replicative DNA helicase